jgi:hypothetical protein
VVERVAVEGREASSAEVAPERRKHGYSHRQTKCMLKAEELRSPHVRGGGSI